MGYLSGCLGSVMVFDPATTAWANAVALAGGTVSLGRKNLVDVLIKGLRADGLFDKFDGLWLFAAENEPSALTDIIKTKLAVNSGTPLVFTTDRGYTGNNQAGTIDTGIPADGNQGTKYTLNNAHLSAWDVTTGGNGSYQLFTDLNVTLVAPNLSGFALCWVNAIGGSNSMPVADSRGHLIANRSNSTSVQGYKNGSSIGSETVTATSLGSSWKSQASASVDQVAQISFGASLSSGDALNFYNRLRTYMTAVGVP